MITLDAIFSPHILSLRKYSVKYNPNQFYGYGVNYMSCQLRSVNLSNPLPFDRLRDRKSTFISHRSNKRKRRCDYPHLLEIVFGRFVFILRPEPQACVPRGDACNETSSLSKILGIAKTTTPRPFKITVPKLRWPEKTGSFPPQI